MNPTLQDVPRTGSGLPAAAPFNVILVYKDQAGAQRGLALCQRLMGDLGGDSEFNLNVCKFAVLRLARLDEISPGQAAAADLVIVCTPGEPASMEQVQAWFASWLELKGHNDCALVVLGEAARNSTALTRPGGFFHRCAQRSGVACLSPATSSAFAARLDARAWVPHRAQWSEVDDGFHHDRAIRPRA